MSPYGFFTLIRHFWYASIIALNVEEKNTRSDHDAGIWIRRYVSKMAKILSFINNGSSEFGSKSMVRQNRNKRALKLKIKNEHTMVNEKLVEISHYLLL